MAKLLSLMLFSTIGLNAFYDGKAGMNYYLTSNIRDLTNSAQEKIFAKKIAGESSKGKLISLSNLKKDFKLTKGNGLLVELKKYMFTDPIYKQIIGEGTFVYAIFDHFDKDGNVIIDIDAAEMPTAKPENIYLTIGSEGEPYILEVEKVK